MSGKSRYREQFRKDVVELVRFSNRPVNRKSIDRVVVLADTLDTRPLELVCRP